MSKRNIAKVIVAGLLAAPLLALAYGPMGDGPGACAQAGMRHGHGASHGMRQGGMAGMGPLRGLDLNKEQQDQVFALMHAQMPAQREKAQALMQALAELRQLSAAERFDADKARALSETVGKLQAERALMRSETDARLRALLTPEQRQKLDERMSRHQGRHGHRHS